MKKKTLFLGAIIIAIIAFIVVYRYYNHQDKTTSLNITEKKWVQDNKSNTIDIEVLNDYPIYGMDGSGVTYQFIKDFKKDIGLDFNEIPYLKNSKPSTKELRFRILNDEEKITDNDLLMFEDYYIAVGKNYQRLSHIRDMKDITFGIFEDDSEIISYYLKSATNISYKQYKDIDSMYEALDNKEVDMIIVPNIMYLDRTVKNNSYSINYYFTEMTRKFVLTLGTDKNLNNIVKKYYRKWYETKFVDEYDKEYFNYYLKMNKISSKEKANLVSKTYTYGYVSNTPYEKKINGRVAGIAGEYLDRISRFAKIEFEYKSYSSVAELKKAIDNKEIDIFFDYYSLNTKNYKATLSTFIEDYVILGRAKDNYIINSFESIKDENIAMLSSDSLYNYVNSNGKANIKTYGSIDKLISKSEDRLIIVDRNIYDKYYNTKFKKYNLLYMDTMMSDYKFMVKNNNKSFYNLVNYIINTNSYYNYKNAGLESLKENFLDGSSFEVVYTIILLIIFLPIIILSIIYLIVKKKKKIKKVKIINRHKYTDMLTSLKNRNYLNDKMPEWEESKVFPQAIIVIDLNNVKYINDNYGHEEGDKLIIDAASKLVSTQLENSEIIRTDGNEFLIYLVGYSEKQISAYTKKLAKELKNLPHEFGAGVGYSMINDEIKTLDDAINEATLDMITNKEDYK